MIERRMMTLGRQVQKSRPSSNVKVKGERSPGTKKKQKSAAFCSAVVLWGAVLVRQFFSGAVLGGASISNTVVSSAASTPVGKSAHAVYSLYCSRLTEMRSSRVLTDVHRS